MVWKAVQWLVIGAVCVGLTIVEPTGLLKAYESFFPYEVQYRPDVSLMDPRQFVCEWPRGTPSDWPPAFTRERLGTSRVGYEHIWVMNRSPFAKGGWDFTHLAGEHRQGWPFLSKRYLSLRWETRDFGYLEPAPKHRIEPPDSCSPFGIKEQEERHGGSDQVSHDWLPLLGNAAVYALVVAPVFFAVKWVLVKVWKILASMPVS